MPSPIPATPLVLPAGLEVWPCTPSKVRLSPHTPAPPLLVPKTPLPLPLLVTAKAVALVLVVPLNGSANEPPPLPCSANSAYGVTLIDWRPNTVYTPLPAGRTLTSIHSAWPLNGILE